MDEKEVVGEYESCDIILRSEFFKALKYLNENKSVDADGVQQRCYSPLENGNDEVVQTCDEGEILRDSRGRS